VERGTEIGLERLGADMMLVSCVGRKIQQVTVGGETEEIYKGILVTPVPREGSLMPAEYLNRVISLEGVEKVSPQLYVGPLTSGDKEFFMVGIQPETDFSIQPWLKEPLEKPMGLWDVIVGCHVPTDIVSDLNTVSGRQFHLVGKMGCNETWTDESVFLSLDAVKEMMREPESNLIIPSDLPPDMISSIMVMVKPGYSIEDLFVTMLSEVPGVWPIRSLGIVRIIGSYWAGLLNTMFVISAAVIALAIILLSLFLSMMITKRRHEIGMLRAIGARHNFIFKLFITEGGILALGGGIVGITLGLGLISAFESWLKTHLGTAFMMPSLISLLGLGGLCLVVTILVALPAIMYQALRASRLDPAEVMREV
jgi:putative ABC transport system permease protein